MKGLGESVYSVIDEVNRGKFTNKAYVGTLANKGTRLAPFHDLASAVPSTLAKELAAIEKSIIARKIKVD
jgi:basic membrane protein A